MRRVLVSCCLLALLLAALAPLASVRAATPAAAHATSSDMPVVDPDYIYNQLFTMVTRFQHREAGYDTSLPPLTNGHDEFAAYWVSEMQADLAGFGPTVKRDAFPITGWKNRPAPLPAVNVEVTVPGLSDPGRIVVIGCHYDAEAFSTQSANDDASGCAIELGVAKAMGSFWRAHHVYPARTVRFVLYDAEEQGIYGSFHYVNETVNGDLSNIVAMFNEEQSGIGYPLRYLGDVSNPTLPTYTLLTPLGNNDAYPTQDRLPPQRRAAIASFDALMAQAVPAVFAEFRALGYTSLTYHDAHGHPVSQPIFTADQQSDLPFADDNLAGSDNFPFALAGLPSATFVGNFTYYDRHNPPPWSYPYDQPQDTIQLMNIYASGAQEKAPSLALALALPGMLTTWMLAQPQVAGQLALDGKPIAAIGDIGQTIPGKPLLLDALASFDPAGAARLSYSWRFGDGTTASGVAVTHTYAAPGTYSLALTVSSPTGQRRIGKTIMVTASPPSVTNPYTAYHPDGYPRANPNITLPTAHAAQGRNTTSSRTGSATGGASSQTVRVYALIIALVLLLAGIVLFQFRRLRAAALRAAPYTDATEEQRRRVHALHSLASAKPPATPPPAPQPPPDAAPPDQL